MKIIGLAGGTGCGKTTVSLYLQSLGFPVFDAGAVNRAAVKKGSACLCQMVELWGTVCMLPNGEPDRRWIAEMVFRNRRMLQQFEHILQNHVHEEELRFLEEQKNQGAAVVFLDLPLMIETGWYRDMDSVWLIAVPRDIQIKRALQRDKDIQNTVLPRINAQIPLADAKKIADVIIDNSGTLEHTKAQIREELKKMNLPVHSLSME